MSDSLIVADVDHIQQYVFGTSRLRAIRGASVIVEQLGRDLEALIASHPGGKCYRSTGGQVVGSVPESVAPSVVAETQRLAREAGGPALSLTTVAVPWNADFASTLAGAFVAVRKQKQARAGRERGEPLLGGGFARHCDLCHEYPAQPHPDPQRSAEISGPQGWYLCESCWRRVDAAGRAVNLPRLRAALDWPGGQPLHFVYDAEQLWPEGQPGRFLALVVADGTAIGRLVECIDSPDLYRDFSRQFDDLLVDCLAYALRKTHLVGRAGPPRIVPVVSGGDDFSALLPAEMAPEFAYHFGRHFEQQSADPQVSPAIQAAIARFRDHGGEKVFRPTEGEAGSSLRLGIGLVVAKPSFPISAYYRLARQLRRSAKQHVSERASGIDFAVITSSAAESLDALRERYSRDDFHAGRVLLTQRPYRLGEFALLMHLRNRLLGRAAPGQGRLAPWPRSKRKSLAAEIWRSKAAGDEAYALLLGRETAASRAAVLEAMRALHLPDENLFAQGNDNAWRTPLLDALELAELAPQKEEA